MSYASHTYDDAGTYTARLTVTGPGGSDTEIKNDFVTVEQNDPSPNIVPLIRLDFPALGLGLDGLGSWRPILERSVGRTAPI